MEARGEGLEKERILGDANYSYLVFPILIGSALPEGFGVENPWLMVLRFCQEVWVAVQIWILSVWQQLGIWAEDFWPAGLMLFTIGFVLKMLRDWNNEEPPRKKLPPSTPPASLLPPIPDISRGNGPDSSLSEEVIAPQAAPVKSRPLAIGIPIRGHGGARRRMTLTYEFDGTSGLQIMEPRRPTGSIARPAATALSGPAAVAKATPAAARVALSPARVRPAHFPFVAREFRSMMVRDFFVSVDKKIFETAASAYAAMSTKEDLPEAKSWIKEAFGPAGYSEAKLLSGLLTVALYGQKDREEFELFLNGLAKLEWRASQVLKYAVEVRWMTDYLYSAVVENPPAVAQARRATLEALALGQEKKEKRGSQPFSEVLLRAFLALPEAESVKPVAFQWLGGQQSMFHWMLWKEVEEPSVLGSIYRDWLSARGRVIENLKMFSALALYSPKSDYDSLDNAVRGNLNGSVDLEIWRRVASRAILEMVRRRDLWSKIRDTVRYRLNENTYSSDNYSRFLAAIETAGEYGGIEEASLLWKIIEGSDSAFHQYNQIAKFDAARAWGRIMVRLGKEADYLKSDAPPAMRPPSPPSHFLGGAGRSIGHQMLDRDGYAEPIKTVLETKVLRNKNPHIQLAGIELIRLMAVGDETPHQKFVEGVK